MDENEGVAAQLFLDEYSVSEGEAAEGVRSYRMHIEGGSQGFDVEVREEGGVYKVERIEIRIGARYVFEAKTVTFDINSVNKVKDAVARETLTLTSLSQIQISNVLNKPIISPKKFDLLALNYDFPTAFKVVKIPAVQETYRLAQLATVTPTMTNTFSSGDIANAVIQDPEIFDSPLEIQVIASRISVAAQPVISTFGGAVKVADPLLPLVRDAAGDIITGVSIEYDTDSSPDGLSGVTITAAPEASLILDSTTFSFYAQAAAATDASDLDGPTTLELILTDSAGREVDAFIILTDEILFYEVHLQEITPDFKITEIQTIEFKANGQVETENKTAKFSLWIKGLAESLGIE